MANPHFEIKITKRSKRQSAVAGAAYQSGENLFSEYDQKHKDYRKKEGVVYTEIMLPSHAPPKYADREQLWNAVEAVENQWNSQLARRFVLALPREVPEELYPQMVQDYCNQFFVSKGMIVDFAIHDPKPPGHNPHCHVMLTMRAMDEHGKWLPKARKVYDLTRTVSVSGFHQGTGKAIRRTLLTGTSSIMGRSGAPAGKQCRTVIWKW